jgi:site-specific recombinase XerD
MLPHKSDFFNYLLSNNYSDKTLFSYSRDLCAFENFLIINNIPFDNVKRFTVDQFKSFLKTEAHHTLFPSALDGKITLAHEKDSEKAQVVGIKRKLWSSNSKKALSGRSINRMLSSLRKYLRYLIINDFACPIPPDKVEFVKREKNMIHLAEFEDLVKLVEYPEIFEKKEYMKKRNRAFLELLFSTGMRISEACSLNLEQLGHKDKLSNHFIINERVLVKGKGRKERFVYLTPRCQHFLLLYIDLRKDELPALFIPTSGSRKVQDDPNVIRVSNNYFQYKIVQYRKLLGINIRTSAHSLRHGFATYMAEKGANVVALQTLLGHESLSTTTKYIHSSDKLAEQNHKEFHPLNNI